MHIASNLLSTFDKWHHSARHCEVTPKSDFCDVEQSYRSALNEIGIARRKKALLDAHCALAAETVMRIDKFAAQIQRKREEMAELRRFFFTFSSLANRFGSELSLYYFLW